MRFNFFACLLTLSSLSVALDLDINDLSSIESAASLIATGLLDYYDGDKYGGVIGMFTSPYYWWEAGGAWGSLIDYTYYLQNDTLVPLIKEALLYQTGNDNNYIPLNQSTTEGNDDQGFWGIAVMAAAEKNFSNPENPDQNWLALAQSVFNTMTARWDAADCNGGLRWQIYEWNSGYNYKNSVSNGCLFHIGARLARYTNNDSYADWSERVWDWMSEVGLLTEGDWWFVYDGAEITNNCSSITQLQWTYNAGLMMSGSAYLYNYTGDVKWLNRTLNLLNGLQVFFNNSVAYEAACQGSGQCDTDQRSFKAYLMRFLGLTSVLVPATSDIITNWIQTSAQAAARSCSGGTDSHTCGTNWFVDGWDGNYGLGEQMCALEAIINLRVGDLPGPFTSTTGGSSLGNPSGGYGETITNASPLTLTKGSTVGASFITAILGAMIIATGVWLIL